MIGTLDISGHLQRVSRSFAFCIAQLPDPLRTWVGLSYLMCRVLDTIEDADFSDRQLQLRLFGQFESALQGAPALGPEWHEQFPAGLTAGELLLLRDCPQIVAQFQRLPPRIQPLVAQMVSTMAAGMRKYILKKDGGGILRLESEDELRGYCYVVAGVVGEALSQILACVDSSFRLTDLVLSRARQFGEFLQKVNILKDQTVDEGHGRFLIPDRSAVWGSSFESARESLAYLESLPRDQMEFRRFCAWSLFLGLETLRGMRVFGQNKVSREAVERVLARVEEAFTAGDGGLLGYFTELTSQIWPEMRLAT